MQSHSSSMKLSTAYEVCHVDTVEDLNAALLFYGAESTELTPVKIVLNELRSELTHLFFSTHCVIVQRI